MVCGTATWGFKHITHRWSAAFDGKIALTLARGEVVPDLQQDGGSNIYALFDDRCHELFRVVYNGGALHGSGVRPQGIISAFYRNIIGPVTSDGASDEAMAASYRPTAASTRTSDARTLAAASA